MTICFRNSRVRVSTFCLIGLAFVVTACGGSDDDGPLNAEYSTLNYPLAAPGGSTLLTGVRGVTNSSEVYISGFYASPAPNPIDTGLIYKGSLAGNGTWYVLNYPSFPGATVVNTGLYGPNNNAAGGVTVVGNYTTVQAGNGTPLGLLYQGPLDGSGDWQTLTPPGTIGTIAHSNMGGLVVGNYLTQLPGSGKAFIYDIANDTYSELVKPGALSITAYGIWHNGGTSYTIAGGVTEVGLGSGYLVDWDSATHTASRWATYKHRNQAAPTLLAHFEGITTDGAGGYNLPADSLAVEAGPVLVASLVNVPRTRAGTFGEATWTTIAYPHSTVTSANTVYQTNIIGVYRVANSTTTNGFVAHVP